MSGCLTGKPNASRNPLKMQQKPDGPMRMVDLVELVDLANLVDLVSLVMLAGFSET